MEDVYDFPDTEMEDVHDFPDTAGTADKAVEQQVPPDVPNVRPWLRRGLIALALVLGGVVIGAIIWHYILDSLPTFRRYMFNEQEEVKLVTETEQSLIWTCVIFPVLSVCYSCCQRISAFVLSHPRIARKIAVYTSIGWACQKIRQLFFGQTLIPMLKRAVIDFLKQCCKCMVFLLSGTLMIIGLRSVLVHYNVHAQMHALISFVGAAIPLF
jgi:hypothetical protein